MTIVLSPKDPSERVVVGFDFSLMLEAGESLTTIEDLALTVTGGQDPGNTLTLDGSATLDQTGTAVLQPVLGGTDNVQYHLTALVNTNQGRRLAVPAILPVLIK
jgi:hypothetical protein